MSRDHRRMLLKLALAIQRQLEGRPTLGSLSAVPHAAFDRAQRQLYTAELADARGWRAAASVCRDRFRWALVELQRQVTASLEEVTSGSSQANSELRDIYEDLEALTAEFPDFRIHLKEKQLGVVTEPISLEGVALGRFQIVLDYQRLHKGAACYEIIPLDPNSAAPDETVVHPHVREGTLCEGEAYAPLRAALRSGRILDFFVIVARTLATYNAQSAFVSLDHWEGVSCADCGCTTTGDDRFSCERCEGDLCGDCGSNCASCGQTNCADCNWNCGGCRQPSCGGCLNSCPGCDNEFCERCLDDGQCTKCRDAAAQQEIRGKPPGGSPAAAIAELAFHAACLGEARLPA